MWASVRVVVFGAQYLALRLPLWHIALLSHHSASHFPLQVLNTESGYHYNALHRWYYDTKSKMYYGGEPPDWTQQPADLPPSARFEAMHAPLTAPRQAPVVSQPKVPAGAAAKAHPLAAVGGYAMPSAGRIGGAKSIGFVDDTSKKADGDQKASVRVLFACVGHFFGIRVRIPSSS